MTVEELYQKWLRLRDQHRALIQSDPEMLAQTPEAKELLKRVGEAWNDYYDTKYPEHRPPAA